MIFLSLKNSVSMKNLIYYFETKGLNKDRISEIGYDFVFKIAKDEYGLKEPPTLSLSENGKPYFKDLPDFHFNISHSKNLLAIAFSNAPVGVDIEKHREINLRIAERYFCETEKQYVNDPVSFFYVWTRKEAYLKKSGDGIKKRLDSFCVLNDPKIKTYTFEGFTLSVCSKASAEFKILANTQKIW